MDGQQQVLPNRQMGQPMSLGDQKQEPAETKPVEKKEPSQVKVDDIKKTEEPKEPNTSKETKDEEGKVISKVDDKKSSEDREEEGGYKPVELTFNQEEPKEKASPENTSKETENVITDEAVREYLKTKGLDVDSLDQLSRKETLSEPVQKFKEFEEQTGRGMEDFLNSQRDWSKESKEDTLREFLKYEYPNSTDEDLDTRVELLTLTEEDEDEMSPKDLKSKKLEINQVYNKALDFMQKKSKEFATPKKADAKPMTEEDAAKAHRPYWDKRDKSLASLNEIKMRLGDNEISLTISKEHKAMLATQTQTVDSLFQSYVQEAKEGEVGVNTDSLLLDQAWANPAIRNTLLADFSKQIQSLTIDEFSKKNRNVNLGKQQKVLPNQNSKAGVTISSTSGSSKNMGKALI